MLRLFAFTALLTVSSACANETTNDHTQGAMSANMHYGVEVTPDPAPPVAGDVVLDVFITGHESEEGVTGATLAVEPWMVSMDHGIQGTPQIFEGSDGHYDVAFAFSMPGSWEIRLDIDAAPGQDDAAVTFDVQ